MVHVKKQRLFAIAGWLNNSVGGFKEDALLRVENNQPN